MQYGMTMRPYFADRKCSRIRFRELSSSGMILSIWYRPACSRTFRRNSDCSTVGKSYIVAVGSIRMR